MVTRTPPGSSLIKSPKLRHAVEVLGRVGYLVEGLVYAAIGVLALMLAFGEGGATTGAKGAISRLTDQPFGAALLWVIAVGLIGFGLYRLVAGLFDVEGYGTDGGGVVKRSAYVVGGVLHLFLAAWAIQIATGNGAGGGEQGPTGVTATVMSWPFGRWLLALAGLAIVGFAIAQLRNAWRASFEKKLKSSAMSATEKKVAHWVGRVGYAARGVVFAIIGMFVVVAAVQADPQETRGLGGALSEVATASWGTWLLALVAVGLIAYAALQVVEARYRRFFSAG